LRSSWALLNRTISSLPCSSMNSLSKALVSMKCRIRTSLGRARESPRLMRHPSHESADSAGQWVPHYRRWVYSLTEAQRLLVQVLRSRPLHRQNASSSGLSGSSEGRGRACDEISRYPDCLSL
jgi:hypothetical protein